MPAVLRGARAAVVFLTRLPIGGFPYQAAEWAWAPAWFPLVGAMIGLALSAIVAATHPLGAFVSATLAYAVAAVLTGAFHEDGLADTADALGGATSRARIFEILKDSRIGSFGGLALVFSVLLRVGLLARLADVTTFALVWSQCVARLFPVWLLVALPYVTPDDTSKSRAVSPVSWRQGGLAAAVAIVVALGLRGAGLGSVVDLALTTFLAAITALVAGYRFHRRAGGVTGDFLGATEQLCECAVLVGLGLTHRPP